MKPCLGQRPSKTDLDRPLQVGAIRAEPAGAEQITVSEVADAEMVWHYRDMPSLCPQMVSHDGVARLMIRRALSPHRGLHS